MVVHYNSDTNIEGCNTIVLHDINKVGDCNNTLKSLHKDNLNKFIFAHLNINSIWNKCELLSEQIKDHVNINTTESFYAELNLRNPHKSLIGNHIDAISKTLDLYSSTYSKIILLGDFNTEIDEQHMQSFYDNYSLKSLIRQPTCCKNIEKPTCIDLILTNMPHCFQSKCVIETGLSNFHLMSLTIIRKSFQKN